MDKKRNNRASFWVSVGAAVLIILLLAWLTLAEATGNTDVAAHIPSVCRLLG